ncbi:Transmembrane protein [Trichinella patagoniensis]|uniref:Transmembrane protein 107 n=1 Tax=Trichinella patagoniensis TaxID=990121 RepID=A0A0V0ZXR8_9BILA|nr:Transmembrane protein [Trichinella patagoniensis]
MSVLILPICCGCFIAGLWQLTGDKHHKGRQFESVFHDLLENSMRLFMMSMIIQKLIPARFLLITAHVVITVCIIWSRDMNVIAGLPDKYSPDDYSRKDFEFTIALCLSFACFFVEYVGFLCGISMFIPACAFFCKILKQNNVGNQANINSLFSAKVQSTSKPQCRLYDLLHARPNGPFINCSLCIHVDIGCLHLRRVVVQRLLVHMGVLLCPAGRGRIGSRFENTAATFRFLDHALL